MDNKDFQKVGLQLIEAAKKQVLMEFNFLTKVINVKEVDFETLLNLNVSRIVWLQNWGEQLQRSASELLKGTLSKSTAIVLNNALQWTSYFEFGSEKEEEEFKEMLKI